MRIGKEIAMSALRYDCHLHSYMSPCGADEMTPENIIKRAKELELVGLCMTDHLHKDTPIEQFDKLREEFAIIDKQGIDVWIGCEVNVYNPVSWSIKPEWTKYFDVILASPVHWIEDVEKPANLERETVVKYLCDMINGAVNCPGVNIISHPFWIPRPADVEIDVVGVLQTIIDEQLLVPTFRQSSRLNIAFEINPKTIEPEMYKQAIRFCVQALECGVKISRGSDAHKLAVMDVWDFHEEFANELGLTRENLWLPSEELNSAIP